ncbi:uncharacterized protein JCM6883_004618 [Sporobolomyces salmoneus]|uniref:uncharacterized protein n=1 Tax=Sporobolomyces salmoneus TaxID=183962 RepID=UPI0031814639
MSQAVPRVDEEDLDVEGADMDSLPEYEAPPPEYTVQARQVPDPKKLEALMIARNTAGSSYNHWRNQWNGERPPRSDRQQQIYNNMKHYFRVLHHFNDEVEKAGGRRIPGAAGVRPRSVKPYTRAYSAVFLRPSRYKEDPNHPNTHTWS